MCRYMKIHIIAHYIKKKLNIQHLLCKQELKAIFLNLLSGCCNYPRSKGSNIIRNQFLLFDYRSIKSHVYFTMVLIKTGNAVPYYYASGTGKKSIIFLITCCKIRHMDRQAIKTRQNNENTKKKCIS